MNEKSHLSIPGPKPNQITKDNIADISACGGLHKFQIDLHDEYGAICLFWLDENTPVVSINEPELLGAILSLAERPRKLFSFLEPLVGMEQVLGAEDAKRRRKQVIPALNNMSLIESVIPALNRSTEQAFERIDQQMADKGCVMMQKELTELSVEAIGNIAFKNSFEAGGARGRIIASLELVLDNLVISQYGLPAEKSKEERDQETTEAIHALHSEIDKMIEDHKQSEDRGRQDFLLSTLVEEISDPVELRYALIAVLMAGYHTTGVAVAWVLYAISQKPGVVTKVQAEIEAVFADDEPVSVEKLNQLPYTLRCIREGLRLYPAGAYGARELQEDTVISGYRVPAFTTIMLPIWAIHLNEKYWPDAHDFKPERFTPDAVKQQHPLAYLPYGFGARSCSGQKLSNIQISYVVAKLLRRYNISSDPTHEVHIVDRFVNWAETDIKMQFELSEATMRRQADPVT